MCYSSIPYVNSLEAMVGVNLLLNLQSFITEPRTDSQQQREGFLYLVGFSQDGKG